MPSQIFTSVENSFTKGLITEATGLNFPENAATFSTNCEYTLIGDVTRREGIDQEINGTLDGIDATNQAISTYVWKNVGGDGNTSILVKQTGSILYFYKISGATVNSPISSGKYNSTVSISKFLAADLTSFDTSVECTYSDGNGYLFVYNAQCDSFYVTFDPGTDTFTGNPIPIQVRDFVGLQESLGVNSRPTTTTQEHTYNLTNQGWVAGNPWFAQSVGSGPTVPSLTPTVLTFTVNAGLTVTTGTQVQLLNINSASPGRVVTIPSGSVVMSGNIQSYSGTTMTITVTGTLSTAVGNQIGPYNIIPFDVGYISTWVSALSNYPSNSDVWWYFKDSTGTFNPATTVANVSLGLGQAPQGHWVLPAFNQDRSAASGVTGLTAVNTSARPTNGAWFAGRVWFTGVNASQPAVGDASYYTWTENIYFSQVVQTPTDFGSCYQQNDPTSEQLFDLLPTDGGVIVIQGAGSIHKLFPIANGLLVFAANGVWFITGSQGIGFAANDYTITKISSVPSISPQAFVDVMGLPYFWNEDGIYITQQGQGGQLMVSPLTVGTIETFYNDIPFSSKMLARGSYDPIKYVIQWIYRSTQETGVVDRYNFDSILNFNTYNKSFYPYTISTTSSNHYITSIQYVSYPVIQSDSPLPGFKYTFSFNNGLIRDQGLADEHDSAYIDWGSVNYISQFKTGFRLRGQGIHKFDNNYIQVYTRTNGVPTAYYIQGIWDYANDPNSGRYTAKQKITNALVRYDTVLRRHRIRGHGYTLQFLVSSVDGMPFDIQGWATEDAVNTQA